MKNTTIREGMQKSESVGSASYLDLAGEAVLAGMTNDQVVAQLVRRIRRDQGYLAYRKACNRKTTYDDQVLSDLRAIALAAMLLENDERLPSAQLRPANEATRTGGEDTR
jgi:hypothetical protein